MEYLHVNLKQGDKGSKFDFLTDISSWANMLCNCGVGRRIPRFIEDAEEMEK